MNTLIAALGMLAFGWLVCSPVSGYLAIRRSRQAAMEALDGEPLPSESELPCTAIVAYTTSHNLHEPVRIKIGWSSEESP